MVFPIKIGILSMWGIGVIMAWVVGIHWSWGVAGIWFGMALDKWVRAIIMINRWHREKWVSQAIQAVASAETAA